MSKEEESGPPAREHLVISFVCPSKDAQYIYRRLPVKPASCSFHETKVLEIILYQCIKRSIFHRNVSSGGQGFFTLFTVISSAPRTAPNTEEEFSKC